MSMWEKKPVLLLLFATAAILVGTVVTMVLPFAWVNTEADQIAEVTPYSPLEQAGRDIYIREGCNNCHSQTVRPLEADVKRYGPYSRSGEFAYDRPFLWGSRRMGPDLARIGKKYPDEWHVRHMNDPESMVPGTNMPRYDHLYGGTVDPQFTEAKMQVLDFPYTADEIAALEGKTEMEAIIAYMQKLGSDLPRAAAAAPESDRPEENPLAGNAEAIAQGAILYAKQCGACHGADLSGGIGPEIGAGDFDDAELFDVIYEGYPDDGMPSFATKLSEERIWKIVSFIQSGEGR